jgi:hypothetical protein
MKGRGDGVGEMREKADKGVVGAIGRRILKEGGESVVDGRSRQREREREREKEGGTREEWLDEPCVD